MADINSDDCYKVLGVPRDAAEGAIKKAYRKMVRACGRMLCFELLIRN